MDPNECLRELLAIAERYEDAPDGDVQRMSELALALDQWLVGGGFLPQRWTQRTPLAGQRGCVPRKATKDGKPPC